MRNSRYDSNSSFAKAKAVSSRRTPKKDVDAELPVLIEAKKEDEKLK